MALVARIKPRAEREILRAADWWRANRPAAPGAIASDLEAAIDALVERPGIGSKVENACAPETRQCVKYHDDGGHELLDVVIHERHRVLLRVKPYVHLDHLVNQLL